MVVEKKDRRETIARIILLTQYTENWEPGINIEWHQKKFHRPMSFYDLPPEIKRIVPIVSKKIWMSNAASIHWTMWLNKNKSSKHNCACIAKSKVLNFIMEICWKKRNINTWMWRKQKLVLYLEMQTIEKKWPWHYIANTIYAYKFQTNSNNSLHKTKTLPNSFGNLINKTICSAPKLAELTWKSAQWGVQQWGQRAIERN